MLVLDITSDRLVLCMPGHNLQEAAYKMLMADCGIVPVVNNMAERRLLGVLTDRDIVCRALIHGHNPLSTRVDECMSHEVVTAAPNSTLDSCCQLMRRYQLRRIVVADQNGRCVGVVSLADIARLAPREVADIVLAVSEAHTPAGGRRQEFARR